MTKPMILLSRQTYERLLQQSHQEKKEEKNTEEEEKKMKKAGEHNSSTDPPLPVLLKPKVEMGNGDLVLRTVTMATLGEVRLCPPR